MAFVVGELDAVLQMPPLLLRLNFGLDDTLLFLLHLTVL